jgi:hypothetical protein
MCKKPPHESQTCEEAAEKVQLNARARVEDAMTAAVVRHCPGCEKAFFKVEGCNKMTCPSCKTLSCYQCRQVIAGFTHFCQTFNCSHDSCGECKLFTDSEQDDRRARREAGLKELENSGNAAADARLLISPPPNKTTNARRSPLEPVSILADNRRALEPAPNPVANLRAPQQQRALEARVAADAVALENLLRARAPNPVANLRAPQQQRVLEARVTASAVALENFLRARVSILGAHRRQPQQQRALEAREPADAAHVPAPENGRPEHQPAPTIGAHRRPPQQQRALEARVPADAAHVPAPENGRPALEPAPFLRAHLRPPQQQRALEARVTASAVALENFLRARVSILGAHRRQPQQQRALEACVPADG